MLSAIRTLYPLPNNINVGISNSSLDQRDFSFDKEEYSLDNYLDNSKTKQVEEDAPFSQSAE